MSTSKPAKRAHRLRGLLAITLATTMPGVVVPIDHATADPGDTDVASPSFPGVTPTPNKFEPMDPFPFDQMRGQVTEADINAEREMCQWFNADYYELKHQIERLNNSLVRNNGRYDADGVQEEADNVTASIDRSVEYLTPRVQSLTRNQDHAGDIYFPLYQGESFYRVWEQLSNVGNGIRAHQPTWFTGPSFQRVLRYGSRINRSHVCR